MLNDEGCAYCGKRFPNETLVRLWDDRWYCPECMERECPGLVEYARQHERLQEGLPVDRKKIIWRFVLFWSLFLLYGLFAPLTGNDLSYLSRVLFLTCFGIILVWGSYVAAMRSVYRISVEHGFLIIEYGRFERMISHKKVRSDRWPLSALADWEIKRSWAASGSSIFAVRNIYCTVLRIYIEKRILGLSEKLPITCGWSPEMRQRWKAFLTLARVSKNSSGDME